MKRQKERNNNQLFLTKLQVNRDFRKSVCDASSPGEMQGVLDSCGFDLDVCQLIRGMAEFLENESEESTDWSYSLYDKCLLELL